MSDGGADICDNLLIHFYQRRANVSCDVNAYRVFDFDSIERDKC